VLQTAGSAAFAWTTWHSGIHYTYGDLEIVSRGPSEELYGARLAGDAATNLTMSRLMKRNPGAPPRDANEWIELYRFSDGVTRIADIQAYGEDTIFIALRKEWGPTVGAVVFCARGSNGEFGAPQPVPGLDAGNYTSLAQVPGTRLILAARSNQLVCFDAENPSDHQVWLSNSDADQILSRAAAGAYKVWVDRLARVVYVGTKGHNQPGPVGASQAIGTVIRFEGPFLSTARPAPGKTAVLANSSASDHSFGFDVAQFGCAGHESESNERYTFATSFATDANNPRRVYVGLGVPSFDYQSNMHPKNGVWLYDADNPTPEGSPWRQVFGAVGSSSWGANRPVTVLTNDPGNVLTPGVGTGKLYIGTDGQGPFWIPVNVAAPPSIAAAASEPIWSTGHATPTTIAVSVSHPGSLEMSTVELYADVLGATGPVAMYDGGPEVSPGTDLVAGDHIYTSTSFNSNVTAGTYQVRVFAQATDGSYDQKIVSVEAVQYAAKFTNVSNELLGLDFSGVPYSAIALDANGYKKDFLLTQSDASPASLFEGLDISGSGTPIFRLLHNHEGGGWRGVASADFNNDGNTDYFIAGATSMLWQGDGAGGGANVTLARGLTGVDNATAACWVDYDRDGWLDLYVVRSFTSTGQPIEVVGGAEHRLYRNCLGEGGGFVDVTAASGLSPIINIPSLSACWADIDQDGDMDLFVALAPPASSGPPPGQPEPPQQITSLLFINRDDGTFVPRIEQQIVDHAVGVTAATWTDVNNDGYPDLAVSTGGGARVFMNDGTGHFGAEPVELTDQHLGYNGICTADQDLDGWQDVLLAPAGAGRSAELLLNKEWAGQRSFASGTRVAGLGGQVPVMGLLAADFTEDGDPELFAGMPSTVKSFFYKTDSQGGQASLGKSYVKIRLESPGKANNRLGVGAKVEVSEVLGGGVIGLTQTQIVDGGSGRGGQRDNELVFGLGDYEGPIKAKVMWPGGWVQYVDPLTNRGENVKVIADSSKPTVNNVSALSVIDLSNNTLTWTFSWDASVSSNWELDEIQFLAGSGAYCPPGGSSVMATDGNVSHTYAAKAGGGYRHSLTIANVDCIGNCTFRYRVGSGPEPDKSYSPWYVKTVRFCPSQF
jgi:hypothetical protein